MSSGFADLEAQGSRQAQGQSATSAEPPAAVPPPPAPAGDLSPTPDGGIVEREAHGPTGGAGSSQAAPSVAGASDISRVSIDSHHSHRSRWSTAATVATTVAARQHDPLHPSAAPLPEELSGGSSGDTSPVLAARRSASGRAAVPAAGASAGGAGSSVSSSQRGAPSPRRYGGASQGARCSSRAARAPSSSAAASEAAAADDGRLPPRLIVFHPDGESFGIGVDKAREGQLQAAAEAAAQRRRRDQPRGPTVHVGPAGEGPSRGSAPPPDDEGFNSAYAGYRQIYVRQKIVLVLLLIVDVVYLAVLLTLRLVWGGDKDAPSLSSAAKFFVGSHPNTTSISYLAGSMFTDIIALYGSVQDLPSVVTLFIIWSVVLGAFAILEMPLLFMILRLLLLIAAFQLRFSMARIRHMLPPASLGNWFAAAGSGVAMAGGAAWGAVASPFRAMAARRRDARRDQAAASAVSSPSLQAASRRQLAGPGTAAALPAEGGAASQLAAVRSSALFRAAVLRMMAEQQRQGRAQDLEAGFTSPHSYTSAAAALSGTRSRVAASTRGVDVARQSAPAAATAAASGEQGGSSMDRLYARIMEDITALAAAPTNSAARRRQRRQERSRRRSMAGGPSAPPGQRRPSAGSSGDDGSAGSDVEAGGGERLEGAVSRAAAAAARTGAGASGAPLTWQDLVALMSYHSQQQQVLRRQQRQQQAAANAVPLVSLQAPLPPGFDPSGDGDARHSSGAQV